ncbi:MAG: ATP-binding protein [Candidatus Omnitrophota bacterium]|nr:ATP-binding protein [Candidatus Omnitrophota bacterium]
MIISVASGKGGTGKTTIAVNLALSLGNVQFLDCDVEEPDSHIFLKPEIEKSCPVSIPVPGVDEKKCNYCGRCAEVCAYNAIAVISAKDGSASGGKNKVLVFPELCHGCGGCALLCPRQAITEQDKKIGVVEIGKSNNIQFAHGRLDIGQAMSPPLIRAVKDYLNPTRLVIIDAPPGTSCPVIEAVKGSNFCILVTEPTPFGLNDLILAVEALEKLKVAFGVVINRSDIGDEKVERFCQDEQIPVLMRIPFDKEIAVAYSKGIPIIECLPEYEERFKQLLKTIKQTAA